MCGFQLNHFVSRNAVARLTAVVSMTVVPVQVSGRRERDDSESDDLSSGPRVVITLPVQSSRRNDTTRRESGMMDDDDILSSPQV